MSLVIHPGGTKTWQYRYRIGERGAKQEKVTLGNYPDFPLADARAWRDDCRGLVQRGLSPMALRRGDITPPDITPAVLEMARAFRAAWCGDVMARERAEEAKTRAASTVGHLLRSGIWRWWSRRTATRAAFAGC
nr:Arm DNA-binding domain-containing protein [Castellaniella sp.]